MPCPIPRLTTTVVYCAGRDAVTFGSIDLHLPTISPLGELASLRTSEARHWSSDVYIVDDVSMGLHTEASLPGLHESKSITAAVAESIRRAPCWMSFNAEVRPWFRGR